MEYAARSVRGLGGRKETAVQLAQQADMCLIGLNTAVGTKHSVQLVLSAPP